MRPRLTFVLGCTLALLPSWGMAAPAPPCGQTVPAATVVPSQPQATSHDHEAGSSQGPAGTHDHGAAPADEIARLMTQIEEASGDGKVDLMAALLKRLVAERQTSGAHSGMCPMCAARMAGHASSAESHGGHNGASGGAASHRCGMMAQEK